MVRMSVSGIQLDPDSGRAVLFLESTQKVGLTILIGLTEARAIAAELDGVESPRPITHDLLRTVLEALDAQLLQVEILELRAETYFAQLVLRGSRRQEIRLDSRPSDAVALAVRTGAAIFVHEQVIEKSQSLPKENLISADKDDWAAILEAMDPEDFGKYPM